MTVPALPVLVAFALGIAAWPAAGHAEKVKTNQSTKVYSRAGEQSPVVVKVKSGQMVTVLAKDGRWLKIRVSGRTGWIPRSKVDMPEDDEVVRNTRRRPFVDGRGTKRGFGGEGGPEDRVGADATGEGDDDKPSKPGKAAKGAPRAEAEARIEDAEDEPKARAHKPAKADDAEDDEKPAKGKARKDAEDEPAEDAKEVARPTAHVSKRTAIYNDPRKDSDESFTAEPRTALILGEAKGSWTFVETEEGDAGYVLTSKLDIATPEAGGGPRSRAIDLRGRLGVTLVRQSLATPGGLRVPPDNYTASSSSITVALGATVVYPYSKRYWLGGELSYDYDKAIPGISYQGSTTSFALHNLNLRALAGYDLQKQNGMILFARLGYHYESFQVADFADPAKNTAKLPNQIISGPMIGAALTVPRLTKDIGVRVSLDTILVGASFEQTKNYEDGTGPSAKLFVLGGSGTYRWKPRMDLQATIDIAYTTKSFSGMAPATSMRGHTGTGPSSGSDLNSTVSVGVAYAF